MSSSNTAVSVSVEDAIQKFLTALIDQEAARVIVAPKRSADGFWFGGGNMVEGDDGSFYLCGRYRNFGDSRTGLAVGERGLELAIFRSTDRGETFEQIASYSKADLSERATAPVLSIEGSCLVRGNTGWTLYVSSEKALPYPDEVADYLKPGTGVWTIDEMNAPAIAKLSTDSLTETHRSRDPEFLHVKDPFWGTDGHGRGMLLFCTHPYNWSSSNTAFLPAIGDEGAAGEATRTADTSDVGRRFGPPEYRFFPRGSTWDVAMTRGTCILPLPKVGLLAEGPNVSVMFYDGGECVRKLDEHRAAHKRPRGYSCEELGGAALLVDGDPLQSRRLSRLAPLFVSPLGTGASRYVDVLATEDGFYATWEQSQDDGSQPLVMNFVSREEAARLLT